MPSFYTAFQRPPRCSWSPGAAPSKTDPSFAKDCDINVIVARAKRTGTLPIAQRSLVFGDDESLTLQQAMSRVAEAREAFEALPAEVRLRFGNDPMALIPWLADPANRDEAVKLGLMVPPQPVPDNSASEPGVGDPGHSEGGAGA
ncbi:VP3 [Gokushovirus WZ-2015a]|nr:VP3 [Gokushovirus WZ-2015a]ALS03719.1 VP3 [Gokushovirus WZ-2015a]